VQYYREHLMGKLQVKSTAELAAMRLSLSRQPS